MDNQELGISPYKVNLSYHALKQMIYVVRDLQKLSDNSTYPTLLPDLDKHARLPIKYHSMLMGYDFHLDEFGEAKLIEVNTNAGGLWLACRSADRDITQFPDKLGKAILTGFLSDYRLFCNKPTARPQLIAIIDQMPERQFLYSEMQVFARLFEQAGIKTIIIDPIDIEMQGAKLYDQNQRIDLIYNRHCDFYLNSLEMQGIAQAWQEQSLCITPNPRTYGLLADKSRISHWKLNQDIATLLPKRLKQALPQTYLLSEFPRENLWAERKRWVFKPLNGYASRGVYVGDKLTRNKFNCFIRDKTLVQERIKPSFFIAPEGDKFKVDFRLFTYRDTILMVSARLYQGQVTNLRTPKGGFAQVKLVS